MDVEPDEEKYQEVAGLQETPQFSHHGDGKCKLVVSLPKLCVYFFTLKDLGTFSKCPQIYIKLTGFEDNGCGK